MSTQEPGSVSEQTPNPNAQQGPGAAPGPTADPERIGPKKVDGNGQPARKGAPEPPVGRPGISQTKLDANRANAQKSPGPTSEAGKKITRMNALTHGLLARETVIRLGDYQEEFAEYLELLDDLWERYRPVGHAEKLEVEIIAKCDWMEVRETRGTNAVIRRRTLGLRQRVAAPR